MNEQLTEKGIRHFLNNCLRYRYAGTKLEEIVKVEDFAKEIMRVHNKEIAERVVLAKQEVRKEMFTKEELKELVIALFYWKTEALVTSDEYALADGIAEKLKKLTELLNLEEEGK